MVPRYKKHSSTFHLPLKWKKQNKLVLSTYYATLKFRQQPLLLPVSPTNSSPFADSNLDSQVSDVQNYLVEVSAGAMPVNHQVIYHIQDALNLLPDLTNPSTTQSFAFESTRSTNHDNQMSVVYLSSLLWAVIALHALVPLGG